jgi:hypothetical protein
MMVRIAAALSFAITLTLALMLAGAGAGAAAADSNSSGWTEVRWPFPIDEWGTGRAFTCDAADCGSEIALYLRAKVGFCSCDSGVTDDGDIDRVGDMSLLSDRFVGLANGHTVAAGDLAGRSRPYLASLPLWRSQAAVAVVLHAKCDAVVATIVADRDQLASAEQRVLAFLGDGMVQHWAKMTLGG